MKDSPSPPPAPDPAATAAAQGAVNEKTARTMAALNRYRVNTPYYSQTWSNKPKVDAQGNPVLSAEGTPEMSDEWSTSYDLTPIGQQRFDEQQRIMNQLTGIASDAAGRVGTTLNKPFEPSGLPEFKGSVVDDFSADRKRAEDAIYARLEPQIARDREALINRTINTGALPGSEPYSRAMDEFNRQTTDARMQAITAGGAEQSRLFAEAMANAQLSNQARNQAFSEQSYRRNLPLNETTALLSSSPVQQPQIQPTAGINVQPVDYASLVNNQYLGQLGNYNAQVAQNNALTSGLFGLGAAGLMGGGLGSLIGGGSAMAGSGALGGGIRGSMPWGGMYPWRG